MVYHISRTVRLDHDYNVAFSRLGNDNVASCCVLVVILKTPLDHRRQLIVDPFLGGSLHSFHLFQQLLHDIAAFLHRLSSYNCHILPYTATTTPGYWNMELSDVI